MGCAGNPIIHTPEMDALARDGVRFRNAFVTTSICAASRASIFAGLYERTHRFTFGTPPMRKEHTDISYPTLMRQAGYRTGFVGKFGVQVAPGARQQMFDSFYAHGHPYFKKQPDGTMRHGTDILGDKSIDFLRSCKGDRPFCLSVSFNAPHATDNDPKQYHWPKAVDGLYRDVTIPTPKTADPAFFEAQPEFRKRSMNRIRWHWRYDSSEKAQEMVKGYYRMISGIDAVLGRLRKELDALGLAEDTVIMLMGDNGFFLGERGWAGKWTGHEDSLRVPLLVYDPRSKKRGLVPEADALNVDIAPTILDLAGLPVPELMQGRSLVPLLEGRTPADWRTDFFHEHLFDHNTIPKYEGVRTQRHTYMRWFEQEPVYEELYDNVADPHQERNLAADPEHADLLGRLRRRCDELRDGYGGVFVPHKRKAAAPKKAYQPQPSALVGGVKGKAAAFDGKSYLRAGSIPALGADASFSWAFWVYLEKDAARSGVVVGNRHLEKSDPTQFMKVTAETVQFYNGRSHSVRIAHGLPREKWLHVAVVKDGDRLTCHADGRVVGKGKLDFAMPALPFYLGGDPRAGEMAACRLDEVALYDRDLSLQEVKALAAKDDVTDGRVGHWPLDEL
jgi:arylsulfatase A-like enzyme